MKIRILCVGKCKEEYWKDAIAEYMKRLGRYCNPEIVEVEDEKSTEKGNSGEANAKKAMKAEADRILRYLSDTDYLIALCVEGKQSSSEEFAEHLKDLQTQGISSVTFLIGGSYGIHEELKNKAREKMSFSRLTFPHQLMRVVLLEQIYRCMKILNHEPYHK